LLAFGEKEFLAVLPMARSEAFFNKRLGLEKLIKEHLSDSRQGLNKWFTLLRG
jgi:hypothetical protein